MYEKQTWNTGDVITEEKLNHMEDGIANAVSLILKENEYTLDKTYKEIVQAVENCLNVILKRTDEDNMMNISALSRYGVIQGYYTLDFGGVSFSAESENDYPVESMS